jgi:hypothetical protein
MEYQTNRNVRKTAMWFNTASVTTYITKGARYTALVLHKIWAGDGMRLPTQQQQSIIPMVAMAWAIAWRAS